MQVTPILAGAPSPCYPGNKLDPCTDLWVCKFQAFSKYYLMVFCPWDWITGLIPHAFNFLGYSDFVQGIAQSGSFLSRARLFVMESTICALLQDHKKLVATAMYCSCNADHRVGNRFTGPQYNKNASDTDYDDNTAQENVDATFLMNIIQAEAHQDDTTDLAMLAEQQNAMMVAASLADVMCNNDLPANIVGQAPVPLLLVNSVMINQSNHAENVLTSIRKPLGPPAMLMVPNHNPTILLPQLLLQPGNDNFTGRYCLKSMCHLLGLNTSSRLHTVYAQSISHMNHKEEHLCWGDLSSQLRHPSSLFMGLQVLESLISQQLFLIRHINLVLETWHVHTQAQLHQI
jgi:hypothetical protein